MNDWATRVRDLRKRRSWTQKRLASELGCSAGTISRWERGKGKPNAGNAAKIERLIQPEPESIPKPARSEPKSDDVGAAIRADILRRLATRKRQRVLLRNTSGARLIEW